MDRAGLRRKLLKAQAEAGDIVLLFGDESEALTHPYLAHAWAKRGADLRVPAPGWAAKVAMLGVLDWARRDLVVRTSRTKRSSDVIALLEELDRRWGPRPGELTRPVVLVLDNGPIHTSKATRAALAERAHWLTVEWLPKYAPELNDIEPAWRDLKRHHLAHHTFTGPDDEVAPGPVEDAEHRHLGGLPRRGDPPVGAPLGPGMREIGVCQRLGLVAEQQHDVARLGLRLQQPPAQARAVHRVGILPALQRVARPPPAESPLCRSTTESREREMRRPERFSISTASRGSVQFGRSATGAASSSSATASARSALSGAGPGGTRFRSASTPPCMNVLRHSRAVSSRTPKAAAMSGLVQPARVSRMARARSASARSRERPSSTKARLCSPFAETGDLPAMIRTPA